MNEIDLVKTRFAPSPTGSFHLGSARTALFNYLYAKKHKGKFLLRLDDTDRERSESVYESEIERSLEWLGLEYDEKYHQTARQDLYEKQLNHLIREKKAYISVEPAKSGAGEVELVRFVNPGQVVVFDDLVRGEITFDTTELGDFVIARSGFPLYHLASVVDDIESQISHVIRGEDHISNTPRQILLLEALGGERPYYAHIPLIMASDGTKLSKRHGALPVLSYREKGYLPQALINFLALLGWSPQAGEGGDDSDVLEMTELLERFEFSGIGQAPARFNPDKLDWLNRQHVQKLSPHKQVQLLRPYLKTATQEKWSEDKLSKIVPLLFDRAANVTEAARNLEDGEFDYVLTRPSIDREALETVEYLPLVRELIFGIPEEEFSPDRIKSAIWDRATEIGRKEVLAPFRKVLTGRERSPDPFTVSWILGKKETLARLDHFIHE